MSRKVCCEVSSNISLFNLVSKDFCSLLGYFSNLHPSERILRNIISVLRMSVNETWIGLLYFWNHSCWNWNKIQTKFLGNTKYKQSLLQKQDTNKVCCKNKIQTKFVAKYKNKHSLLQKQSTKKIGGKSKIQKFRLQNWTGRSIVQRASKNAPISWGSFFPIPV